MLPFTKAKQLVYHPPGKIFRAVSLLPAAAGLGGAGGGGGCGSGCSEMKFQKLATSAFQVGAPAVGEVSFTWLAPTPQVNPPLIENNQWAVSLLGCSRLLLAQLGCLGNGSFAGMSQHCPG